MTWGSTPGGGGVRRDGKALSPGRGGGTGVRTTRAPPPPLLSAPPATLSPLTPPQAPLPLPPFTRPSRPGEAEGRVGTGCGSADARPPRPLTGEARAMNGGGMGGGTGDGRGGGQRWNRGADAAECLEGGARARGEARVCGGGPVWMGPFALGEMSSLRGRSCACGLRKSPAEYMREGEGAGDSTRGQSTPASRSTILPTQQVPPTCPFLPPLPHSHS